MSLRFYTNLVGRQKADLLEVLVDGKPEIQVWKSKMKLVPPRNLQDPKDCTVCLVSVFCNHRKSASSATLVCLLSTIVPGRRACAAFVCGSVNLVITFCIGHPRLSTSKNKF